MSGETLRAPRQQLRLLRASGAFDLALDFQGLIKSAMIARLSGARRVYGFAREALREPASRILLLGSTGSYASRFPIATSSTKTPEFAHGSNSRGLPPCNKRADSAWL